MNARAGVLLAILLAGAATATAQTGSGEAAALRRVILVHSFGRHFEPYSTAAASFRTALALGSPRPVDVRDVLLEPADFSGEIAHLQAESLRLLREEQAPDLVVSIGAPAFRFCFRHREMFAGVPLLAAAIESRHLLGVDLGNDATAVTFSLDFAGFLEDLLQLLPATTQIGVVIGDSPIERFWTAELKHQFQQFDGRVAFTWFNELGLAATLERTAALPPHTAVVFGMMAIDATGIPYEQHDALDALCQAANAPVFGLFEEQIGRGIVGGRVTSARALGALAAEVAVRILEGEPAASIGPVALTPPKPVYDHRQLERWKIRDSLLPSAADVRFRAPSLWAAHRSEILIVSGLLVLQSLLILVLIANHRRLRVTRGMLEQSTQRTQELRRQLSHSGRVSMMGQMLASISHELGQPLGAILRNADAAELFLNRKDPDLDEIRSILSDIRRDDERAVKVIARLRALLSGRAAEMKANDVHQVVGDVVTLVQSDANARQVDIDQQFSGQLPLVRGDRVELQQVLINLIMNGMDAIDAHPNGSRRIIVAVQGNGHAVEFSVRDTGSGFAADQASNIFEPFVSTRRDGMGMGLAISKAIVEAHGGRIWAENEPSGGAVFRFTVPITEGRSSDRDTAYHPSGR